MGIAMAQFLGKSPYELGVIAYNGGFSAFTNPVLHDEGEDRIEAYIDWFHGWEDAKRTYQDTAFAKFNAAKAANTVKEVK